MEAMRRIEREQESESERMQRIVKNIERPGVKIELSHRHRQFHARRDLDQRGVIADAAANVATRHTAGGKTALYDFKFGQRHRC